MSDEELPMPVNEAKPVKYTAKKALREAFEKVVSERDLSDVVHTVVNIASDPQHPLAMQAVKWMWDRGVGPVVEQATKVEVVTLLRFEDRRDGSVVAPQRITAAAGGRASIQSPDGELDIDKKETADEAVLDSADLDP